MPGPSAGSLRRPWELFGSGRLNHTLLILAATRLLAPAPWAWPGRPPWGGLLYVLHNLLYALSAYPVGALADRVRNHRRILAFGYAPWAPLVPLLLIPCFLPGRGGAAGAGGDLRPARRGW